MCSYRERKADPAEMLQLDGFTVDYCEPFEGCSLRLTLTCLEFWFGRNHPNTHSTQI